MKSNGWSLGKKNTKEDLVKVSLKNINFILKSTVKLFKVLKSRMASDLHFK